MKLPYADNQLSENVPQPRAHRGCYGRGQQAVTAFSSARRSPTKTAPVAVAVLVIDRTGCVKSLNSAAVDLLGVSAQGRMWPLLRSAVFGATAGGSHLLCASGQAYVEEHSLPCSQGERILCLQPLQDEQLGTAFIEESFARLVHQIRTPLTAAGLYLDQLDRQLSQNPILQRLAQKPGQQLLQAEQLILAALGQSPAVSSGESMVAVSGVLRQLYAQCAVQVAAAGGHLHCAEPDTELYLHGEQALIVSALANIVINAAQHPVNGHLLRVCVSARQEGSEIVLEIGDTGSGVPLTMQNTIFEACGTSRSEGSGLGLSVAKQIFTQHHARVAVMNNAEGGATFSVRFPTEAFDVAA